MCSGWSDLDRAMCFTDRGNAQNEDFVAVGRVEGSIPGEADGLFGVLLDGATGLFARRLFPEAWCSDAQWLSHTAGGLIVELLRAGTPAEDALHTTVKELQDQVSAIAGTPMDQVGRDAIPSCTLSVVLLRDGMCSVYVLGDSPVVVSLVSGSSVVMRDECLVGLDASALSLMVRRSAGRSTTAGEKRALVEEELRHNRRLRNTDGGYWCFDPTGAGLEHLQRYAFKLADVRKVAAYSDGFFAADDTYGLLDLVGEGEYLTDTRVQSVCDRMRVLEAADVNLDRFPRFKQGDDASMFQLRVRG